MDVLHFSDPGCPWAWSASPALAVLRWRYGSQLNWRHVMIGLAERGSIYADRGYTGLGMAQNYRSFRRRGMPFATTPREQPHGTWGMCRAIVATRLLDPDREWAAFRALQVAQFTSTLNLETTEGVAAALDRVPGLDVPQIMAATASPEVEAAFAADREEARSGAGGPAHFQGKAREMGEGVVRLTAPSVIFVASDGRRFEAGGFQPVEAYDVAIANLDRSLTRRAPTDDVAEILDAFPDGLTTAEVAAVMAPENAAPDRDAAEDALIALAAQGGAQRVPLGNDAMWSAAAVPAFV